MQCLMRRFHKNWTLTMYQVKSNDKCHELETRKAPAVLWRRGSSVRFRKVGESYRTYRVWPMEEHHLGFKLKWYRFYVVMRVGRILGKHLTSHFFFKYGGFHRLLYLSPLNLGKVSSGGQHQETAWKGKSEVSRKKHLVLSADWALCDVTSHVTPAAAARAFGLWATVNPFPFYCLLSVYLSTWRRNSGW